MAKTKCCSKCGEKATSELVVTIPHYMSNSIALKKLFSGGAILSKVRDSHTGIYACESHKDLILKEGLPLNLFAALMEWCQKAKIREPKNEDFAVRIERIGWKTKINNSAESN